MGDSETVVAQTSAVIGYSSTAYTSSGYSEPTSTIVPEAAGDYTSAAASEGGGCAVVSGSSLDDGNKNDIDPDAAMQEIHAYTGQETVPAAGVNVSTSYDASVNGNVASEAGNAASGEKGNALDNAVSAAAEQQLADGSAPAPSAEEERLWNIVRVSSLDFSAWTELIDETEKVAEDNILKIRKVYDAFLAEFPLCYGYWKKYADHEARFGFVEKVVEVYERAVQGVTYSVDIWLHYCIFAVSTYGDPDTVRRLFERGIAYVGTDYLSYTLWDKYIEYEYMQQEWGRLAIIYTRILENPNQQLDRYLHSFKELAGSRPLSELRTAEEAAAIAVGVPCPEAGTEVNEGEANPDAIEESLETVSGGLTEAEDLQKYISIREEMYKKAKEFDSKIIGFESAIKRPYFHVRPLNPAELENWHHYLDFIEREEDLNKVVRLYERCLIACANYPEYWMRYILCMEASGSMDLTDNALARASQIFVKRQPEIHLFAARFKEKKGDIVGARAAFQLVHSEVSPGLLEAIIKHANMERRVGNLEDAFKVYEHAIAIEKEKELSEVLSMLYAQYSRFIYLVSGNSEKAREILVEATERVHLSKPFLEGLIHLESVQSLPKQIDFLDSLVGRFIAPDPNDSNAANLVEREELSSIYLEFLDTFGDSESVKKADDLHAKLFLRHRSTSEFRKRHAEDYLASDRSKMARSQSGVPSPAQPLNGAYPSAQTQWPTGYGSTAQAWPPTAQAQGQQWTPGYTQQTAYGGYGASYPTPQAPTSIPQNTAYGAYPPAYPAQQPYTQQSYVQPAAPAVAGITQAQQPASVPQAYYGSYY